MQGASRERRPTGRSLLLPVLLCATVAACERSPANDLLIPNARHRAEYLTGAAAAALGGSNQFALRTSGAGELTEADAKRAAAAYLRDFGAFHETRYEREHNAPIMLNELRPCSRAFYGVSPYTPPPGSASEIVKRAVGPFWLVPLCTGGSVPEVLVALSARATDMEVDAGTNGHIGRPMLGLIRSVGIPVGTSATALEPEAAATALSALTGKRVSEVPVLELPPLPYSPLLARWRITLEGPARVEGLRSRRVRDSKELYVGFGTSVRTTGVQDADVGAPIDPALVVNELEDPSKRTGPGGTRTRLELRADVPQILEWISAVSGGGR